MGSDQKKVFVTQELIDQAIRADSSHCMIADAIAGQFPDARQIVVDLQSIRWSDPRTQKRYIFLTPRSAQEAIIRFDLGDSTLKAFSFTMRPAQIIPMRRHGMEVDRKKMAPIEMGKAPLVEGGKPPKIGALPGTPSRSTQGEPTKLGKRRTFGLRGLRPDIGA